MICEKYFDTSLDSSACGIGRFLYTTCFEEMPQDIRSFFKTGVFLRLLMFFDSLWPCVSLFLKGCVQQGNQEVKVHRSSFDLDLN